MAPRILFAFNSLLALCLIAVAWVMLPMAHTAGCGFGGNCQPIGFWQRAALAALPATIAVSVAALGLRVSRKRPRAGTALLLLLPVALGVWIAVVWLRSSL